MPPQSAVASDHVPAPPRFPNTKLPWAWLLVAVVIIATFYPGVMSNDSIASLKQARTFEFTSWHPPIMALIWSVLDRLVEGPALMLVAQAILYATAAARLCVEAFPRLLQRFTPWCVVPLFALFPPVMALNGMIWKDVWMSALLLFALAYLFRIAGAVNRGTQVRAFLVLLVACLLATAFRHNAIAATAGLLAGAVYFLWPHQRAWLRLLGSCIGGVLLATALLVSVSLATRLIAEPAHVTTPILMHDIAGMIVKSNKPWEAARHALSAAPAISDTSPREFTRAIKREYTPVAAGRILRTSRRPDAPFAINVYRIDHDAESVKRAWRAMIKRYPGAYLRHRTHAFSCLLQLCDITSWIGHSYVLNPRYVRPVGNHPAQTVLRRTLASPTLARLYAPALWLAVVLAAGLFGLARIDRHPIVLFMGLSGLGLAVSLFFTSPIESYRYMHWVALLGWITLPLMLDQRLKRKSSAGI